MLFQTGFVISLGCLGIAVLLLSEHLRYKIRRFVYRHFKRPYYDYRKIWIDFTEKTVSLIDTQHLCDAIAKTVSGTFLTSAVSIWLFDEDLNQTVLVGSTALSPQTGDEGFEKELELLIERMRDRKEPVDLTRTGSDDRSYSEVSTKLLEEAKIRCCVPLAAGGKFLGILTLNDRIGVPFSIEDFDLLKTLADQAAGLILNHKLFESLGRAKEMQAFQTLSAFFAHDLKNVASTLSLTLQNLPILYDNPEFRVDALKMISNSVEKIKRMCGQLSMVNQKFELQKNECDLNELVVTTLADLSFNGKVATNLEPVPKAVLDSEQIRKVILNLLLNANEASGDCGKIRVETGRDGDHLVFSVIDGGCGLPREFVKRSLFHPFRTTKERGSGIGLYQCKMIVEAHNGKIEVLTREGCGSTFRVLLPLPG
jgi:putative PEP-CTERM system histidine kinase